MVQLDNQRRRSGVSWPATNGTDQLTINTIEVFTDVTHVLLLELSDADAQDINLSGGHGGATGAGHSQDGPRGDGFLCLNQ